MTPQFKTLPYKAAKVAEARLIEAAGDIGVVMSEFRSPDGIQLSRMALPRGDGAAAAQALPSPQPLMAFNDEPGWDIASAGDKAWRVVSFRAGSAVAPLVVQATDAAGVTRVDPDNFRGVFQFPRFVRHAGAHPPITAVDVDDRHRVTVYMPQAAGKPYAPRQALGVPPGVVQDARLVPAAQGYVLLIQRFKAGAHRRLVLNGEPRTQRTGVVEAWRLDLAFKPMGQVWHPFGDQPVYQFDADAFNGQLAVLASTPVGWRLLVVPGMPRPGHEGPQLVEGKADVPLTSPSVVATASGLTLLLLADVGTDQARLWLGHWQPAP